MITKDPILEELRQVRERLLAEAGGTLEGLVAKLQAEERLSDRKFILPQDRPCSPNVSVQSADARR